jgi:putative membrane protein
MNRNLKAGLTVGGIVAGVVIIILLISGLLAGWRTGSWSMMGPGMMGNYGLGWFIPVGMIIFWGLIIWGIVALVRYIISSSHTCTTVHARTPVEILKSRYASGEISKEEFEDKKRDLI